jgi:mannose-1-phosphate guanylyltransferase
MSESKLKSPEGTVYAVVLAGGHGERFWPLSRRSKPKHHLALFSERTLLSSTLDRLSGFIPPSRTIVLTGVDQAEAVRALLPEIPPENVIVEPHRRDTAAAMALAAGIVARRDPAATVVVLPADHRITDGAGFQRTIASAIRAAQNGKAVVTVAVTPDWPCPGFGYLELGRAVDLDGVRVREIRRFHEKPTRERAAEYLESGNFFWNAGMFVWTVDALREALSLHAPELSQFCSGLVETADYPAYLAGIFGQVPKLSFDYAVMEKLGGALAVEAGFDWDDLGGWVAAGKYYPQDEARNAANTRIQALDSTGNTVFSCDKNQLVALVGVSNLVVVNTGDALLVCAKEQAERIKELVGSLPQELL